MYTYRCLSARTPHITYCQFNMEFEICPDKTGDFIFQEQHVQYTKRQYSIRLRLHVNVANVATCMIMLA